MNPDFKNPKDMWDARYSTPNFVYGEGPNQFFKVVLQSLAPGRLLLPAEGEGRNAIHGAASGWKVDAFDWSPVAQKKATDRAESLGLSIRYDVADLSVVPLESSAYSAIALIFVHLPPAVRTVFHRRVANALAPGGTLILQAYHPRQLARGTGGPNQVELLYDMTMLRQDFADLEWVSATESVEGLNEGILHRGQSELISLVLRKRPESHLSS